MKILEKAIKNKLEQHGSKLFETGDYQTGFKKGKSTALNTATILNIMLKGRRKRTERKIFIKIDLTKAYDNVNRKALIKMLVNDNNQNPKTPVNIKN